MAFDFPELHGPITLDLENHDPKLKERGSGWPYKKTGINGGKILGFAYHSDSTPEGGYVPIGHTEGNEDPIKVKAWLKHQVTKDEKQPKIFANALYDVGWLTSEDLAPVGPIEDIMFQAPLLDESRMNYQLDRLGKDYLGEGKDETLLAEAAKKLGLKNTKKDNVKSHLMIIDPKIVGIYATQDACLTRKLWDHFNPMMIEQELNEVYQLECDLIPILIAMRMRGVRVDVRQCELEQALLVQEESIARDFVKDKTGITVGSWDE